MSWRVVQAPKYTRDWKGRLVRILRAMRTCSSWTEVPAGTICKIDQHTGGQGGTSLSVYEGELADEGLMGQWRRRSGAFEFVEATDEEA